MKLYIKNMVCNRCILVVRQELEKLGIPTVDIALGEVELQQALTDEALQQLSARLTAHGFELLDDHNRKLIEKIKNVIIEHVHYRNEESHLNFSEIISRQLHKDYSYLSSLFSAVEGVTIEKYIISQKIEKVKELLIYDELSLSEIAWQLGYSSVAHLSAQFRKVTGLTPTYFRQVGQNKRKPLDGV